MENSSTPHEKKYADPVIINAARVSKRPVEAIAQANDVIIVNTDN
jgi:hypothetical protein